VAAVGGPYRGARCKKVAGVEARGFVLGGAMAAHTGAGFVAIRKADGFLPGEVVERVTGPDWRGQTYGLRMQRHSLTSEDRVVLVDDWTRSGAKIVAARPLLESTRAT